MTRDEVNEFVENGVTEIAINAQSLVDAKPRAGRMLSRVAALTYYLRQLEEELPKLQTLVNAKYALAIQQASGKNITEKKVEAEANPEYTNAVEQKAELDAQRDWTKNFIKIFDNAHIMYRQFCREE